MKNITSALLVAVSLIVLASCGGKESVPVDLSIVPIPVSMVAAGKPCDLKAHPDIKTRIDAKMAPEEYELNTGKGRVEIKAGSEAGIFWARQTLAQLEAQYGDVLPGVCIHDKPVFSYRGAHLDCCRHFFTVDEVKAFIDMMALHKLNVFHWHLTEDQGWRAEIKQYPKLTEVGSVRKETLVGHYGSNVYDGTPYGGFYTQDDMRDVVAYAAERFITVVPEIEMPGHASAALASYPELGCRGKDYPYQVQTTWGVFPEVFCAGNPETVTFLEGVLDEICDIFPSEYIHIGGDEAPREEWEKCPKCQALMKEKGFTREAELQSYLITTVEKYLADKGRKIIGWDEILEGGVSQSATVMSWRGAKGGIEAAKMGNDVIMTPNSYFYFDYYQTGDPAGNGEPMGIGGNLPLSKCYAFDPYDQLNEDEKAHIRGIQANMWTEYVATFDHVQHMVLPRMAALSEVAWSCENRTSYDDFLTRLTDGLKPIYDKRGYRYADYAFKGIE
jgi:hexosaminidase